MPDRGAAMDAFLTRSGWANARREALAGDASSRRYIRLIGAGGGNAILMDAPPDICGSQDAFVARGQDLRAAGVSAPEVMTYDPRQGFVLMEDLGDNVFARVIASEPGRETALYEAAADALVQMQSRIRADALPRYGPREMAAAIRPSWHHYRGERSDPSPEWLALETRLEGLLSEFDADPVFIHRDYHAENVVFLGDRAGIARVGVLDFQDAMAGHPLYDLASLLQDARRTVSKPTRDAVFDRFARSIERERDWVEAAFAVQATQRHLRILGIFARLARERGKPGYLSKLPRVWDDLQSNLRHPLLAGISGRIASLLSEPVHAR